jgi:uncharacterized protein YlaN (UPF0358 family)
LFKCHTLHKGVKKIEQMIVIKKDNVNDLNCPTFKTYSPHIIDPDIVSIKLHKVIHKGVKKIEQMIVIKIDNVNDLNCPTFKTYSPHVIDPDIVSFKLHKVMCPINNKVCKNYEEKV